MRTKRNIILKSSAIEIPFEHIDGVRDFCSHFRNIFQGKYGNNYGRGIFNIEMLVNGKRVGRYSAINIAEQEPLRYLQKMWIKESKRRVKVDKSGTAWELRTIGGEKIHLCSHNPDSALADDLCNCNGRNWSPDDFDVDFNAPSAPYQYTANDRVYLTDESIFKLGSSFNY